MPRTTATTTTLTSPFAPLTPDGPLAPAVTETIVSEAFRSVGLRPKLVLLTLDIKTFVGSPAARLRRAMDKPAARRERHGERERPALHDALYIMLRRRCEAAPDGGVYALCIEPAEVERDERTFLDAKRFAKLVAEKWSAPASAPIEPGSDAETVLLFACAFAMLQPEEASAIVAAVAARDPAWAGFFGVT